MTCKSERHSPVGSGAADASLAGDAPLITTAEPLCQPIYRQSDIQNVAYATHPDLGFLDEMAPLSGEVVACISRAFRPDLSSAGRCDLSGAARAGGGMIALAGNGQIGAGLRFPKTDVARRYRRLARQRCVSDREPFAKVLQRAERDPALAEQLADLFRALLECNLDPGDRALYAFSEIAGLVVRVDPLHLPPRLKVAPAVAASFAWFDSEPRRARVAYRWLEQFLAVAKPIDPPVKRRRAERKAAAPCGPGA